MTAPVYVLGGYQTDFARNWKKENKQIEALLHEAVRGGLEATAIEPRDIQTGHVGNFAAELYSMQGHLGAFLIDIDPSFAGLPTARHEAACASGSVAILAASAEIEAGRYDTALVVGVEQMKTVDSKTGGDYLGIAAWYEREAKGIDFPFPKLFGRLGDEYDSRFGLKDEHLSRISAINFSNAKRNPLAQTRNWFSNGDAARAADKFNRVIAGRIKISDCSQVTDGAVSLLLASGEAAARYAEHRGISLSRLPRILGWGHSTASIGFDTKIAQSREDPYVLPHTRRAILDAFERAAVADIEQIDVIETHDCFTTSEYMAIDHFGLTKPGESWKAIEDGTIELTGKLPINPSGGLIGAGHPVGATGCRQVLDAYKQLTETAGDYQIGGARRIATLNLGGSGTTSVAFVLGV